MKQVKAAIEVDGGIYTNTAFGLVCRLKGVDNDRCRTKLNDMHRTIRDDIINHL